MRVQDDRAGLGRLEARLGIDGAVAFFDSVVNASDDYELGLAVGASGDDENVLLSYNPRTRRGDFRERALRALEAASIDTALARDLFGRVPPLMGSTVVGLEWRRGGGLSATVYVEELTRFLGAAGARRVVDELAGAHGQSFDVPTAGGDLYILAVDLPGPAVKVYRIHEHPPTDLMDFLGLSDPDLLAPGAAAFIEQWHLPTEKLKVYRCYDYTKGLDDPEAAAVLYGKPPLWSRILIDELGELMQRHVHVTSVGHRYAEPSSRALYWCASGPGVP